jgi:WD40 repeat protein
VTLTIPKGQHADFADFSPGDSRIVTLSNGGKELQLWDWAQRPGAPVATLEHEEGSIRDFAFSPDGQRLATASFDKTAKIWDATTGQGLFTLSGHTEYVNGVAFSPNGRWVVTASGDKTAQIWDAATGENLMQLGWNNSPRTCVAFSPDGQRIITGTLDGPVPIYTYEILGSGQELRRLAEARRRELTPAERNKYLGDAPRK